MHLKIFRQTQIPTPPLTQTTTVFYLNDLLIDLAIQLFRPASPYKNTRYILLYQKL